MLGLGGGHRDSESAGTPAPSTATGLCHPMQPILHLGAVERAWTRATVLFSPRPLWLSPSPSLLSDCGRVLSHLDAGDGAQEGALAALQAVGETLAEAAIGLAKHIFSLSCHWQDSEVKKLIYRAQ